MFECSPLNAESAVNTTDAARDRTTQMPASRQSKVTLSRTGTGSGTLVTSAAAHAASSSPSTPPVSPRITPSATRRRSSWRRVAPSA